MTFWPSFYSVTLTFSPLKSKFSSDGDLSHIDVISNSKIKNLGIDLQKVEFGQIWPNLAFSPIKGVDATPPVWSLIELAPRDKNERVGRH